jgi:hypothetical protein
MKLAYGLNRVTAGIFLVAILFAMANYYFDLGFFRRGAKAVLTTVIAMFVIYGAFFAPTRQEMREHRDARRRLKSN